MFTKRDNKFIMFINQTIMLYTLKIQCCMSITSQKKRKKEQVGLFGWLLQPCASDGTTCLLFVTKAWAPTRLSWVADETGMGRCFN